MRTTLITGATDGIGLALAERIDARGERLVLVGRRPVSELGPSAAGLARRHPYCVADLGQPDSTTRIAAFLRDGPGGKPDRVVLNAAEGWFGEIPDQDTAGIGRMAEVNLVSPLGLTHALSGLLTPRDGLVCFVSSVVSSLPSPRYAVYAATKAALEGFARSLRIETGEELRVRVVRPGATRTGLHEKMGLARSVMDWTRFPSAGRTAAALDRALEGGGHATTLGAANKLVHQAGRLAPGAVEWLERSRRGRSRRSTRSGATDAPRCVVTGAADGIGRALALRLARDGYEVVGIDVDEERSARTESEIRENGGRATFLSANLAVLGEVERVGRTLADGPPVQVLVHNAGINRVGRFTRLPFDEQREVLALNLVAPMALTAGLLREDALASAPTVMFMSSLSHFTGYPGAAAYAASKDGIASYARSLSASLGQEGRVLTVFPGPVRTRHAERHSPDNSRAHRRMPPEALAERLGRAIDVGRRGILVPGAANRAAALAGRLWPSAMEWAMRRAILDKLDPAGSGPA